MPLDIRWGGHLRYKLKIAEEGEYDSCVATYQGAVEVQFLIPPEATPSNNESKAYQDLGLWTPFASFEPALFRSTQFHQFEEQFPPAMLSNGTQIRFTQPVFVDMEDHFALDDVQIYRLFEPGYQNLPKFRAQQRPGRRPRDRAVLLRERAVRALAARGRRRPTRRGRRRGLRPRGAFLPATTPGYSCDGAASPCPRPTTSATGSTARGCTSRSRSPPRSCASAGS